MIDVHCHLTDEKFGDEEIADIIGKARNSGITGIITNGTSVENSGKAVKLAEKYPEVWAAVGIHPEEITNFKFEILNQLRNLAKHKKVVAVGEIGLDYREGITDEEKTKQKELFKIQLELAGEVNLPVVVHCRNAFDEILAALSAKREGLRGILMHCWTGNWERTEKFLSLGCYFSFGGMITYDNNQRMRNVAKMIPADRLLLETDSPYSLPTGAIGTLNTPVNVKIVAEKMAEIRNTSVREIEILTLENARRLFELT